MSCTSDCHDELDSNPLGLIFLSQVGTGLDPGNSRRQWREARGKEFDWVKPSSFRKTVVTLIEREAGSLIASRRLGHSSDTPIPMPGKEGRDAVRTRAGG